MAAAIVVLLLWTLATFGGAELWAAAPFGAAALLAVLLSRPQIAQGCWRTTDRALLTLLALIAFQMLPLPRDLMRLLSPNLHELRTTITLVPEAPRAVEAISIRPSATAWAALVIGAAICVFWTARRLFERGGVRRVVRSICTTGIAVSVLAIAQAATAGRSIYWTFPTDHEGPLPFGPFVNRNHFATWVIMAAPLCFGYIAARSDGHAIGAGPSWAGRTRVTRLIDGRSLWLFACGAAMVAALLLSLSRSGMIALAGASVMTMVLAGRRSDSGRYWWFVAAAVTAVGAAMLWSDVGALVDRLAAAATGIEGRVRIWRETLPIVRDFWLTGTGSGTYRTAMLLYQQSDRLWYFNQAHNHYLQLAAEGGLLLSLPTAVALAGYAREAVRRAREDPSGMFWIRSGALCGLGAAALQSVWETGLTMPANAALAAVLAALAVHHRPADGRS